MDFIHEKSFDFKWGKVLRVQIEGTGKIAAVPKILAAGSKIMDARFTRVVDLALNYTGITTENYQSFS